MNDSTQNPVRPLDGPKRMNPLEAFIRTPELEPHDRADLHRSGLSDETIASMGCYTADADTISSRTGVVKVDGPGYCIPYGGANDQTGNPYVRWRLRQPIEKMRYVSGRGDDARLYIPPSLANLPPADLLVVTEGEKKAAKAVQEGIHCVGIQGVWSWFEADDRAAEKIDGDRVSEDTAPLTELVRLARQYKRVLVLGDSDLLSNVQARRGFELLSKSLSHRGIRAGLFFCPPAITQERDIAKQGLDDWLKADRFLAKRTIPALFRAVEVNRDAITDNYNAREFTELFSKQLAFSQGQWWHWSGSVWEVDGCEKRLTLVPQIADSYLSDADKLAALLSNVTAPFARMKGEQIPADITAWCAPIKLSAA